MRKLIQKQTNQLLDQFEVEPSHVRHVSKLADQLFVQLKKLHGLDGSAREKLAVAALLHDIGWSQTATGAGHHKHSARMIRAHTWQGFEKKEVLLISLIARYHRKALPCSRHKEYLNLCPADQRLVGLLAGILRVADALDRTHLSMVRSVKCQVRTGTVYLKLQTEGACVPERQTLSEKKDLFELAYQRKLVWT